MYLRFKAIKPIIEAHLIDLPGVDPIFAVKAEDASVQLIPRSTFLRLDTEVNDAPGLAAVVKPVKRSGRPKKASQVALSSPPPKQESPKGRKPSPVAEKCLSIPLQHGPLTSAELSGHLYPEVAHRFRVQNFSALSLELRKKAWIEKRTEPSTGIDKWYLTEAGKGQL